MGANTTSSVASPGASPQPVSSHADGAASHDVVVIGASAGGVEVLKSVIASLPADYPGAIFVVLHIPPSVPSVLPTILRRASRLRCVTAVDGAPVEGGTVYVAPPNAHLLLEPGRVCVSPGPRENGHRPAVDPLFRSAAVAYGPRVVGVVLTGNLDDGTRGLLAITQRGGVAVVQDPTEADFPGMPQSAIANTPVHHVLRAADIGVLLATLAPPGGSPPFVPPHPQVLPMTSDNESPSNGTPLDHSTANGANANGAAALPPSDGATPPTTPAPAAVAPPPRRDRPVERVADIATGIGIVDGGARINESLGGTLSAFTCPECHGALWELRDGVLVRYRCRVGHAYTDQGLVDNKARAVEDALWTALTALEESAALAARVCERARAQGRTQTAETFRERAEFLEQRGTVLREVLNEMPGHVDAV